LRGPFEGQTKAQYELALERVLAPYKRALARQMEEMLRRGKVDEEMLKKMEVMANNSEFLKAVSRDSKVAVDLQEKIAAEIKRIAAKGEGLINPEEFIKSLIGDEVEDLLDNDPEEPDPLAWARDAMIRPLGG
jgi:hypothetical protein